MTRARLKLGLSVAGLVLVAVALKVGDPRLNWLAIAVLGAAVLVRFTGPRGGPGAGPSPAE